MARRTPAPTPPSPEKRGLIDSSPVVRPAPPPKPPTCQTCGGGLLHELFYAQLRSPYGYELLCLDCMANFLRRHVRNHAEAKRILDEMWQEGDA